MDVRYSPIAQPDRDKASDLLRAGLVEGRLDSEEFNGRLARLFNEVSTYDDLWAVIGDQPGAGRIMPISAPSMAPVTYLAPMSYPPSGDTNGFAIASMICGLVCLFSFGLSSILAVVFGHIARSQIRREHRPGNGMAIAGLVLGYLGLVFLVLAVIGFALLFTEVRRHPGYFTPQYDFSTTTPPGVPA